MEQPFFSEGNPVGNPTQTPTIPWCACRGIPRTRKGMFASTLESGCSYSCFDRDRLGDSLFVWFGRDRRASCCMPKWEKHDTAHDKGIDLAFFLIQPVGRKERIFPRLQGDSSLNFSFQLNSSKRRWSELFKAMPTEVKWPELEPYRDTYIAFIA